MSLPAWVSDYVGIPFHPFGRDRKGCDCWGLVRLVLAERFGLDVPSYDGRYAGAGRQDVAELGRLIDLERRLLDVAAVPAGAERAGDIVLLRVLGQPCHVGVVVAAGHMLHVEAGIDAMVERYRGVAWERRVLGFWRPEGLRCPS